MAWRNLVVARRPLKGDDVRNLQLAINRRAAKTSSPRVTADGVFGLNTLRAARREGFYLGAPDLQLYGPCRPHLQIILRAPWRRTPAEIVRGTKRYIARRKAVVQARSDTSTVAGCARILLDSPNVSFWSELSTGSDRPNVERLARRECSKVFATGGCVFPQLRLMQALVEMSHNGHIMINALTGGHHITGSHHYSGHAVDLDLSTGNASMIEAVAHRHGGSRNFETNHIHLDF